MKVSDLIKMDVEIDVYDDVCDALEIAFCGPAELTEEGKARFADVMDFDVEIIEDTWSGFPHAIVHVDDPDEKKWKRNLKQAKTLFEGLAGYCSEADYNKWFKEV